MVAASACSSSDEGAEVEGDCQLDLALGTGDRDSFSHLSDGDAAEIVLGFQGFRMLDLALRVDGSPEDEVNVLTHLGFETGDELDQRDGRMPLVDDGAGHRVLEDYLVFINDVPIASVLGSRATLEVIVRSDECTGSLSQAVELRDDDECIDFDHVLDAAVPDSSVADMNLACD